MMTLVVVTFLQEVHTVGSADQLVWFLEAVWLSSYIFVLSQERNYRPEKEDPIKHS